MERFPMGMARRGLLLQGAEVSVSAVGPVQGCRLQTQQGEEQARADAGRRWSRARGSRAKRAAVVEVDLAVEGTVLSVASSAAVERV